MRRVRLLWTGSGQQQQMCGQIKSCLVGSFCTLYADHYTIRVSRIGMVGFDRLCSAATPITHFVFYWQMDFLSVLLLMCFSLSSSAMLSLFVIVALIDFL